MHGHSAGTDKTTSNGQFEEVELDRFVAAPLGMVSRTPHNKEKGQYLGTKSSGKRDSRAFRVLLHTNR
jgi:hypothetical protein